jgi:hypothetical protein
MAGIRESPDRFPGKSRRRDGDPTLEIDGSVPKVFGSVVRVMEVACLSLCSCFVTLEVCLGLPMSPARLIALKLGRHVPAEGVDGTPLDFTNYEQEKILDNHRQRYNLYIFFSMVLGLLSGLLMCIFCGIQNSQQVQFCQYRGDLHHIAKTFHFEGMVFRQY